MEHLYVRSVLPHVTNCVADRLLGLSVACTIVWLAATVQLDCKCGLGTTEVPCCVQVVLRRAGNATATASARPVFWASTTMLRLSTAVGRVTYVTIAAFRFVMLVIL